MGKKTENAINLYLDGIRDGNYIEAINKYTGDHYTQHSTGVKDGKEGFIEFFSEFVAKNSIRDIQIIRQLEDGANVFIQAYQNINRGASRWITTDFFDTDKKDKIIEHWDVIAEYRESTESKHTPIDGPTEINDLDKTSKNKKLVRNFIIDAFMPCGNPENISKYISKDQYIQHNVDVEDGFEATQKLILSPNRPLNYSEIVLLVGQGNFVATLCKTSWKVQNSLQEMAQVDIFRIEDGLIVEHWDNTEPVPDINVNSGKF